MSVGEYQNMYANCDHMDGKDRTLRVGGEVICPTTGWSAALKPRKGNTGINPYVLSLDLSVTAPGDGEVIQEVLTPTPFSWEATNSAFDYTNVVFRRADGAPPPGMKVTHRQ